MIIVVEGIQGVGKTTFCKNYAASYENVIVLEEWVDEKLLADYIADMPNKATEFQFAVLQQTIKRLNEACELSKQNKTVLVDRGLIGNQCFAEVQHDQGYISEKDIIEYRNSIPFFEVETWHLICNPYKALQRIKKRDRVGEDAYSFEYLSRLKQKHDLLLCPYKIIDVSQDLDL
jgi:deoxyadenosine/deoxycytidine kinase